MGFLRAVPNNGNDNLRIGNAELLVIMGNYIVTPYNKQYPNGGGPRISWEGSTTSSGAVSEYSYREAILQTFGGSDLQTNYLWAKKNADDYGVSKKTY